MLFGKRKPEEKREPINVNEIVGNSDKVTIDYAKLKASRKQCEEQKGSEQCRREFKELGIEFSD